MNELRFTSNILCAYVVFLYSSNIDSACGVLRYWLGNLVIFGRVRVKNIIVWEVLLLVYQHVTLVCAILTGYFKKSICINDIQTAALEQFRRRQSQLIRYFPSISFHYIIILLLQNLCYVHKKYVWKNRSRFYLHMFL